MKTVNVEMLTKNFNTFRMQNLGKTYTSKELYEILHSLGFSNYISRKMTHLFVSEHVGKGKTFKFTKEPVYKSKIELLYIQQRDYYKKYKKLVEKPKFDNSEEAAILLLKSKGYQIKKVVGFDLESLKKDYSEIYSAYLKYELI